MKKGIFAIFIGCLLSFCNFPEDQIYARESEFCEIEIQLNDLGTPMEGVEFTAYKIESAISEQSAAEWEKTAGNLTKSIETAGKSGVTGTTNYQGRLILTGLEQGMYLIVQNDAKNYGIVAPFLVSIPYQTDGTWENQVRVNLKGELFKPAASESVDSGDEANVMLYGGVIVAALFCGCIAIFMKKKKCLNMFIAIGLMTILIGESVLPVAAAESIPAWATEVTIENPPDDQYVYQFSDSCPLYQRGQYRFGCGAYDCGPSPIILLVDGSEYNEALAKKWTANSLEYIPGVSNYELTYCADFDTSTVPDQFYKKVNVEDSTYFENKTDAYKLRAIIGNTYPFVSAVDMVKKLYADNIITDESILLGGKTFSDELVTADIDVGQLIAATQMAVWVVCNDHMNSASVSAGKHRYYTLHEANENLQPEGKLNQIKGYPNANHETATEFPMTEGQAKNINAIYKYLMELSPVTTEEADQLQQLVITDLDYAAAKTGTGNYDVTVRVLFNTAIKKNDNLMIKISSSLPDSTGNPIEAIKVFQSEGTNEVIGKEFSLELGDVPAGADITIELSGEQYLNHGVYFYEPYLREGENERTSSQNMVGASVGYTPVKASASFNIEDEEIVSEVVMPSTGSIGINVFYGAGLVLVSTCFCFIINHPKYRSVRIKKERGK